MSDEVDETAGVLDHVLGPIKARLATAEQERDEARRFLREAGDEMRARWNAINESLAVNRDLEARLALSRKALEDARGIVGKFADAKDSDEELSIIHELEAWSAALDATPVASPPLGLLDGVELETAVRDAIDFVLQYDEDHYAPHIEPAVKRAAARIRALASRT